MKKYYNAPAMEFETFETADIITVSPGALTMIRNAAGQGSVETAPTIDVATLNFVDPE